MKKRMFTIMVMAFAIVLVMNSCKKENVTTQSGDNLSGENVDNPSGENGDNPSGDEIIKDAVTDIDGNTYDAVKLGDQVWMAENLRTTKYADGTSISLGSSTSTTTAYRYYPDNNSSNVSTYGYLYNWPAVMGGSSSSEANPSGVQGICPTGWHVPSDAEWTQLTTYVKSQSEYVCDGCSGTDDEWYTNCIAKALASTTGWYSSDEPCTPGDNPSANNATGFSAVPAGYYFVNCINLGFFMYFWSATQYDSSYAFSRYLGFSNDGVYRCISEKFGGYSVRCLRD